jgi:hypothetical protein
VRPAEEVPPLRNFKTKFQMSTNVTLGSYTLLVPCSRNSDLDSAWNPIGESRSNYPARTCTFYLMRTTCVFREAEAATCQTEIRNL